MNNTEARDAPEPTEFRETKIVIILKEDSVTVGAQRADSDPYIERFPGANPEDIAGITDLVHDAYANAQTRWASRLMNPTYDRPEQPKKSGRRQNRKKSGQPDTPEQEPAANPDSQQTPLQLF